jgi:hypothetical protein
MAPEFIGFEFGFGTLRPREFVCHPLTALFGIAKAFQMGGALPKNMGGPLILLLVARLSLRGYFLWLFSCLFSLRDASIAVYYLPFRI